MNELYHHGIKGMRWGVRKQQKRQRRQDKLNKLAARQDIRENRYQFIDNYMRGKGPIAYARWYSSGSTSAQRRCIKQGQKRIAKLLNKYGKEYSMTYDVMTGQYELKDLRNK